MIKARKTMRVTMVTKIKKAKPLSRSQASYSLSAAFKRGHMGKKRIGKYLKHRFA